MYNVTRLLDVAESDRAQMQQLLGKLAQESGAARHLVAPTLPGSRNGGDVLFHLRFGDSTQWDAVSADVAAALADPAITGVNGADYHGSPTIITERTAGTVYRTLLLRVEPDVEPAVRSRFCADLQQLPGYVSTISAWQLSQPHHTVGNAWTHVFEQEFSDSDGIMGAYLMHPIHWAVVDQWFDPECPKVIVRQRVCHSFCLDSGHVLR